MAVRNILLVTGFAVATYQVLHYFEKPAFNGDALRGKNVLLIGASSGIGVDMAYWYARFGANVFISARREEKLKQVAAHCETLAPPGGCRVSYIAADMDIEEDRIRVFQAAMNFFNGEIDQLVLNHAIYPLIEVWNGSDAQLAHFKKIINVNLVSFVHMTALALPSLKRSNGYIAVVGSVGGRLPSPLAIDYSAAKYALDGFFSGLRFEFKATNQNVSITFINLGVVETDHAVIAVDKMAKQIYSPYTQITKAKSADAAYAIIEATTLRRGDVFYPTRQLFWIQSVVRVVFPELMENLGIKIEQ